MRVAEVFGFGVQNQSTDAWEGRKARNCPFRGTPCTKASKTDPLGICSLTDGTTAVALCPVRFLQDDRIFKDAAGIAFGEGAKVGVFPEVRILKIEGKEKGERDKKIGKVDFIIGKIEHNQVTDFAAVEVQAVYFSGGEMRTPFQHFLKYRELDPANSDRRPDFRSSAQKRLFPQLQLKVPVFRRWGKKFFVVVDSQFFRELPTFPHTTPANSELTWLPYCIEPEGYNFTMRDVQPIFSEWDDVRNALREGKAPEPSEIVRELQRKLGSNRIPTKIVMT